MFSSAGLRAEADANGKRGDAWDAGALLSLLNFGGGVTALALFIRTPTGAELAGTYPDTTVVQVGPLSVQSARGYS